jgi:hypothetical protein
MYFLNPTPAPLVPACIYGCLRVLVGLLVLKLGAGDRDVELLLLRHELSVLRRTVKKPRLRPADRMIMTALAMPLPRRACQFALPSKRTATLQVP